MKTPDSAPKTTGPGLSQTLKTLGLLFLLGSLASCSTSAKSSQATFEPNHWHKVSDSPPTYFPKGVPANHPTGPNDGKWVLTEDGAKTSYFIPFRGVSNENLLTQAATQMNTEDEPDYNGEEIAGGIVGGTIYGFTRLMLEVMAMQERNGITPPNSIGGNAIRDYETSVQ